MASSRKVGQLPSGVKAYRKRRAEQLAAALRLQEAIVEVNDARRRVATTQAVIDQPVNSGVKGRRKEVISLLALRADELLAAEQAERAALEEFREITEREK